MDNLTIREATKQDVPAILELYRDAQIDGDGAFTVEEAVKHLASLNRYPYFHVFVALSGGAIAGTYELVILDNVAKRGKKSGVVEDVAIGPDHQGKGIGRAMMEHALEECRLAGCYKMTLSSNLKREERTAFTTHSVSLGMAKFPSGVADFVACTTFVCDGELGREPPLAFRRVYLRATLLCRGKRWER